MQCATDEIHYLRVRQSGNLEIPAALLDRVGLGPGERLELRVGDAGIEISRRKGEPGQFVAWRDISHQLLTES